MDRDPAAEYRELSEIYRSKSDYELENLAAEAYDLTDIAREVLETEIRERQLALKLNYQSPAVEEEAEFGPASGPEDEDLAGVCQVSNMEDLLRVVGVLNYVDTPYVITPGNVSRVQDFRGSFEDGVVVQVAGPERIRVLNILQRELPEIMDGGTSQDGSETAPTCPSCHSEEIVFLSTDPHDKKKFRWRCDACGNKWVNDGVVL